MSWDAEIKKCIFWNFQNINLRMQGKIEVPVYHSIFTSFQMSSETNMQDTNSLFTEKWQSQYRDETLKEAFFGKTERQHSNARNIIDKYTTGNVFKPKKISLRFS